MATYTSTQNGNWNDTATWGGGGYPSVAADIAVIGHTVTYNVVSTTELGAITINSGGILTFSAAMSTKLTLGHADITVNNGGELRVGASGAIIPKTYTAELIWNPTSDGAKGINIISGGKLTIYGDPDYYGSVFATQLYNDWNGSDLTIYLKGDFSSKWITGQRLVLHKGRKWNATTCSDITGFAVVSINGAVTYDGAKSTVPISLIHVPNTATSFLANGDVLNISRNVSIYKLAASENVGVSTTYKPYIRGTGSLTNCVVDSCKFLAVNWGSLLTSFNRTAWQNHIVSGFAPGTPFDNTVMAFAVISSISAVGLAITNSYLLSTKYGYGAISYTYNCRIYGYSINISSYCSTGMVYESCFIYSCNIAVTNTFGKLINCSIGYDEFGNAKDNNYDLSFDREGSTFINCKTPSTLSISGRNTVYISMRFKFEHYQQIANAHYICDAYGDITKTAADGAGDNPTQRSGGNADVIEAIPQSNCAAVSYLELLNIRLWAAAGVSKTYRFYVQTDFAVGSPPLPSAELKLYGQYLDAGSGGHLATVSSTQDITTRANAADWSQYVEVTMNPAQDGYINLYLRLMGYEANKKVWVDPMVAITGGDAVTVTPRWSYGEVQLDIDPVATGSGGGVSPTNLGLVPLGIKQVAI